MTKIKAAITGVNGYVPEDILSNKELEKMVDTNDEWIVSRTGISERRILKDKDKASAFLGTQAVKGLLEKTNTNPLDIDLIVCPTVTPDMIFPSTANLIAGAVGATNAFAFDISAACSGFVYGISMAAQFIETGRYKKVIVVGAEKMSSIVDYTDRATCIIFGDGAGAVLLEPNEEGYGVLDFELKSDAVGKEFLHMKAGGSLKPASHETIDAKEHFVYQEGQTVFKYAVSGMSEISKLVMDRNGLTGESLTWLVPHQANKRILDYTAKRIGVAPEKVMMNIAKYGNTTAATIPLCLWDYESQLKKGDTLVLTAFGGGFTWGAVYIKWAYDKQ